MATEVLLRMVPLARLAHYNAARDNMSTTTHPTTKFHHNDFDIYRALWGTVLGVPWYSYCSTSGGSIYLLFIPIFFEASRYQRPRIEHTTAAGQQPSVRDICTPLTWAHELTSQASSEAPTDERGLGQWVAQFYILDRAQLVMDCAEQLSVALMSILLPHGAKGLADAADVGNDFPRGYCSMVSTCVHGFAAYSRFRIPPS